MSRLVNGGMNRTTVGTNNTTNTNKKENTIMRTNKEMRMETLKNAGVNTNNFFNLSMDIPVGADVQIMVNGIPYNFGSSAISDDNMANVLGHGNTMSAERFVLHKNDCHSTNGSVTSQYIRNNIDAEKLVERLLNDGYVFNRRTDGRFVVAQTFKMLKEKSWNNQTRQWEYGWDAYLRNNYGYSYQFEMMIDEVHRLARMEKENDIEFAKLRQFFDFGTIVATCNHAIVKMKKKVSGCYSNRHYTNSLIRAVHRAEIVLATEVKAAWNYSMMESALRTFAESIIVSEDTAKCSNWREAFKGKGAYVTLLNMVKFHNVKVINPETDEFFNREQSIAYIDSLLETYKGEYWRFHELLKKTIEDNNFDLRESIKATR